ncbi:division/cell wall cluster transcriptional repressor MraZ [Mycoplasma crocodyli]|uniref:Transcriptional regulator MraZ n=1 Tax=Mycoplasma crocodyli (strain ATCC 51981 / MP145) TaxID=512564 RepID=D5E5L9_MYCCM|nr:division/cell wall cluster transcriptional repressor MraZ [Mycoplasma crocodyli]ADE19940.1 cell division protein MraZ [Mycoplasma crocodyli MP145]
MFGLVERKLDDKKRIILPSSLRDGLGSCFYLTLGFDGNAELRSKAEFEKYTSFIENLNMFDRNSRILRREILGKAVEIVLDSQARFIVPKNILDALSIQKEVVFIPVGSSVELWSKEKYDEYNSSYGADEIANIAQSLSGGNK